METCSLGQEDAQQMLLGIFYRFRQDWLAFNSDVLADFIVPPSSSLCNEEIQILPILPPLPSFIPSVTSAKIPRKSGRIRNVYFQTLPAWRSCLVVPAVYSARPINGLFSCHLTLVHQSVASTEQARTKLRFRRGNYPLSFLVNDWN